MTHIQAKKPFHSSLPKAMRRNATILWNYKIYCLTTAINPVEVATINLNLILAITTKRTRIMMSKIIQKKKNFNCGNLKIAVWSI